MTDLQPRGYAPIADHGAIGNLRTAALVALDGTIDWCCMPHLDSASVFASILDRRRGGWFRVAPAGAGNGEQRYLPESNVLETSFSGDAGGTLRVIDFMPLVGPIIGRDVPPAPEELHRIITCEGAAIDVEVSWAPRLDYAQAQTRIRRSTAGWRAILGDDVVGISGIPDAASLCDSDGPVVHCRFTMQPGERRVLVMRWGGGADASVACSLSLLRETLAAWEGWVAHGRLGDGVDEAFGGNWRDLMIRSGLTLKLLTNPDTGAMAAAATTSLPEHIGGSRNWDYRFAWIRDAALTGQALVSLGHRAEALDFLYFLQLASQAAMDAGDRLQIMYGLHGQVDLTERVLSHLEGYRGSRPVRVGNAAADQRQLDVFGELLGAAYEYLRQGGSLPDDLWQFLAALVDRAASVWTEMDHGIWEVRGGPRHFVHSKLMIWVALDRGICIANRLARPERVAHWRQARAAVRAAILEQGWNEDVGAFVQSFGSRALDAANLLIPIVGFLPFEDRRVQRTIDLTLAQLGDNGLIYRYLTDDGLPGGEGAFGLTTCWAADALILSGRIDEGAALIEQVASHANHLGLFSEEFDTRTREQLGNFPQAFTHIGFINSALYLARAEGRQHGGPAPMGTRAHREEAGHDPSAAA